MAPSYSAPPAHPPHSHPSLQQRPLRNRALVVPFCKIGRAPPKYMLVRHRPTQEWGLLSGTCGRGERPALCGMRELREETHDAVIIDFNDSNTHTTTVIWPQGGVRYHVYFVDISNYRTPAALRLAFHASKRTDKGYDETDDITFATLEQLRDKKKVWEATQFVIRQQNFLRLHHELISCAITSRPKELRRLPAVKSPPKPPPKPASKPPPRIGLKLP